MDDKEDEVKGILGRAEEVRKGLMTERYGPEMDVKRVADLKETVKGLLDKQGQNSRWDNKSVGFCARVTDRDDECWAVVLRRLELNGGENLDSLELYRVYVSGEKRIAANEVFSVVMGFDNESPYVYDMSGYQSMTTKLRDKFRTEGIDGEALENFSKSASGNVASRPLLRLVNEVLSGGVHTLRESHGDEVDIIEQFLKKKPIHYLLWRCKALQQIFLGGGTGGACL